MPSSHTAAGARKTTGTLEPLLATSLPSVAERTLYTNGPQAAGGAYTPTADDLAADGDVLVIEFAGNTGPSGETVALRYGTFGSFPTPLLTSGALGAGLDWHVRGTLRRTGATTQAFFGVLHVEGATPTLHRTASVTGRTLGSTQLSMGYDSSNNVSRVVDFTLVSKKGAP